MSGWRLAPETTDHLKWYPNATFAHPPVTESIEKVVYITHASPMFIAGGTRVYQAELQPSWYSRILEYLPFIPSPLPWVVKYHLGASDTLSNEWEVLKAISDEHKGIAPLVYKLSEKRNEKSNHQNR